MRPLMNLGLAMALLTLSPMAFAEDPATSVQPEPADYFAPQAPEVSMTYDRGDVIPVEFGVRDWQDYYAYGLPSAPRGQEWGDAKCSQRSEPSISWKKSKAFMWPVPLCKVTKRR